MKNHVILASQGVFIVKVFLAVLITLSSLTLFAQGRMRVFKIIEDGPTEDFQLVRSAFERAKQEAINEGYEFCFPSYDFTLTHRAGGGYRATVWLECQDI